MEVQGGFKIKRKCPDQLFVLRGLCEILKRERYSYLAFIDISKAYDSMEGWFVAQNEKVRCREEV